MVASFTTQVTRSVIICYSGPGRRIGVWPHMASKKVVVAGATGLVGNAALGTWIRSMRRGGVVATRAARFHGAATSRST
jgi:hypothetical protein